MADNQWNDVYMRKNFQDVGNIPSQGGWTCSPDIIPNGTDLINDPVTTLTANWNGPDAGKQTVFEQQNYFYVRGKNLSQSSTTAKFELYYCPSNLFLYPSLWKDHQMKTSSGLTQVSAAAPEAGSIMVPNEPFAYIPENEIHSCLIGRVITDAHPNPIPEDGTITTMDQLAAYIQSTPNMAWRNVDLVDQDIPVFNRIFDIDVGAADGQVMVFLECINVAGSSVSFSSGTPIPSGPDKGKYIAISKTKVNQDSMSIGTQIFTLPAGFKTTVSYSYFNDGAPVKTGWQVNFHAILITSSSNELFLTAKPLHEFLADKDFAKTLMAQTGMEKGISLGSIYTMSK